MSTTPFQPAEAAPSGLLAERLAGRKPDQNVHRQAFWRMLRLVWPHRRRMALGLILGFFVAATYAASLGGMLPVLKVIVGDQSLAEFAASAAARNPDAWYAGTLERLAAWLPAGDSTEARMRALLLVLGVLIGLNLLGNAMRVLSTYYVLYASHRVVMDLRRKLYRKALHIPMTDLLGDVSGRVSHFMTDVREIFLGLTTLFGKVAREPLKAICVLAVALWLDARLTLAVLLIAPIAVTIFWIVGRRIRKATVKLLEGYGLMLGVLEESLQGVDTVKSYAREADERRRMWSLERRMMKQQLKIVWIEALTSPVLEVIGLLAASAGIVWLAGRTFTGEITTEHFMTMVILLAALLDPVRKVANVYNMVQRSGGAAVRLFEFLDAPEEPSVPRESAQALPPSAGGRRVTFESVGFRYPGASEPALCEVTLEIQPGECVAIVGPNGSGKSTLVKLLPRLLDATSGCVRLDGTDIRNLVLKDLRQDIAVVTQRPVIFARTARENLAYGHPGATLEEIRAAAGKAFAAEFIEALPQGYETRLGQFGASISGGQRQRIAIARAFLKPASILIFDEATSEIDADSEHKIHAALGALRRGKTTFLVAHRHTVMDLADRVLVMDGGRVIDFGPHAKVIERCELYAALYRSPAPH